MKVIYKNYSLQKIRFFKIAILKPIPHWSSKMMGILSFLFQWRSCMIKIVADREDLGSSVSIKNMMLELQRMRWMERWMSTIGVLLLSLPFLWFHQWLEAVSDNWGLLTSLLKALLGRPLRITYALEKVRGAPVVVPRLSGMGNDVTSRKNWSICHGSSLALWVHTPFLLLGLLLYPSMKLHHFQIKFEALWCYFSFLVYWEISKERC